MTSEEQAFSDWKLNNFSEIIYEMKDYCINEAPVLLTNPLYFKDMLKILELDINMNNPFVVIDDTESQSDMEDD
tara:strand:- start:50 stop:271 length:222 start_codon:yes stop_codon:yes gene_type:complete